MARVKGFPFPAEVGFGYSSLPAEDRGKAEDEEQQGGRGESFTEGIGRRGALDVRGEDPAEESEQGRRRQGEPEGRGEGAESIRDTVLRDATGADGGVREVAPKTAARQQEDAGEENREDPLRDFDVEDRGEILPEGLAPEELEQRSPHAGEGIARDRWRTGHPDQLLPEVIAKLGRDCDRLALDEIDLPENPGELAISFEGIASQLEAGLDEIFQNRLDLSDRLGREILRTKGGEKGVDLFLLRGQGVKFVVEA